MSCLKLNNAVRLLNKSNALRASAVRNLSLTPQNNRLFGRQQAPYDDTFFGLASNLMRSLEREFDYARRQMDKTVGLLPQTYLPSIFNKSKATPDDDIITVDQEGNRKLQISFDLGEFDPEEIKVKTHGHTLKISAKREKKTDTDYYLKEFTQSYSLPRELKLEDLKSKWSDSGVLTIEAPLPKQLEGGKKSSKEREIPIEHGQEVKNILEGAEAAGKTASNFGTTEQASSSSNNDSKKK